ncbi:dehydrogenase [Synechococcus sp. Tobar12-5m-g]|uniref:dehydrogenase n=1 Tax=unclassified Synechococcus TaxID=2626047 RepID=UPI0020CCD513|nr:MULTISPECIES: dehydrogenase [unclassified Synechococcus]MCP9772981.1 dehydrogenase [Synechococcus sp. Tobar12-5m-g]MCP9873870.1 dehydrogenase [Synechococcus sp. Cruz CV-v-12]
MRPPVRSALLLAALFSAGGGSSALANEIAPRSGTSLASGAAGAASLGAPPATNDYDPLTGPRSRLAKDWIGLRALSADTPILVMAGHADSQNIGGSGTHGAAVALARDSPMFPGITDELYWNIVIAQAVVQLGQQRGLQIRYHEPPFRTIVNGDAPGTNWSAGREHSAIGGYALEIHFDAYGPDGIGSGLIPAINQPFSRLDESLAAAFGAYPMAFRGGLGGPKRGIALLEIGKLEGTLEANLRDPARRPATVQAIAERVVVALQQGLGQPALDAPGLTQLNPPPGGVGSAPPGRGRSASPGAW